jgi:hypothetical protein
MANYYGTWRSNYFKVKNEEEFLKWFEGVPDAELSGNNSRDGFCILQGQFGDGAGFPSSRINEETDEAEEFDMFEELAPYLKEGEVAIFMEAGAEKLRYVCGYAVAVKWDGKIKVISLDNIYNWVERYWKVKPSIAGY